MQNGRIVNVRRQRQAELNVSPIVWQLTRRYSGGGVCLTIVDGHLASGRPCIGRQRFLSSRLWTTQNGRGSDLKLPVREYAIFFSVIAVAVTAVGVVSSPIRERLRRQSLSQQMDKLAKDADCGSEAAFRHLVEFSGSDVNFDRISAVATLREIRTFSGERRTVAEEIIADPSATAWAEALLLLDELPDRSLSSAEPLLHALSVHTAGEFDRVALTILSQIPEAVCRYRMSYLAFQFNEVTRYFRNLCVR